MTIRYFDPASLTDKTVRGVVRIRQDREGFVCKTTTGSRFYLYYEQIIEIEG